MCSGAGARLAAGSRAGTAPGARAPSPAAEPRPGRAARGPGGLPGGLRPRAVRAVGWRRPRVTGVAARVAASEPLARALLRPRGPGGPARPWERGRRGEGGLRLGPGAGARDKGSGVGRARRRFRPGLFLPGPGPAAREGAGPSRALGFSRRPARSPCREGLCAAREAS